MTAVWWGSIVRRETRIWHVWLMSVGSATWSLLMCVYVGLEGSVDAQSETVFQALVFYVPLGEWLDWKGLSAD